LANPTWEVMDKDSGTWAIAVGSGGRLYKLRRDGSIWKQFNDPKFPWQVLDNNPATKAMVFDEDRLYQIHRDGSIFQYTGVPITGWEQLDSNPATTLIAAG
jgi:hypothetical protein